MSIILVLSVLVGVLTCEDGSSQKQEKKEIVYNSEWDGSVKQVEDYLKVTLNDADSYGSVEWGQVVKNPQTKEFTVRHKYRANNVFGGKVLKHQLFLLDSLGTVINVSDIE